MFLVFTVTTQAPGLLGGIALGVGVALILTARWPSAGRTRTRSACCAIGRAARTADGGVTRGYYVAGGT